MSEKPCGAYFFAFFENFFVPILTSGGLAAVSSSFFAALCSAFGKYDVVHIHAEGPAFFAWLHLDNIQKKGYVLEFGHLSRDKGTDTLLEVAKKMPNTEFVFIGYGPSVDKMKDIGIVTMLLGFALHMAIRSSFIDYREKVDEYLTSTLLFTVAFSVSMTVIVCSVSVLLNLSIPFILILLCMLQSMSSAIIEDYSYYLMMKFKK